MNEYIVYFNREVMCKKYFIYMYINKFIIDLILLKIVFIKYMKICSSFITFFKY